MVFHPLFIWRCSKVLGMSYGHWHFCGVSFQKPYLKISLFESTVFFLILKIYLFDFFKTTAIRFNCTLFFLDFIFFLVLFTYDFSILVTSSGLLTLSLFLLFLFVHACSLAVYLSPFFFL